MLGNRDGVSNISVAQTLAPEGRAASANGAGVDLRGYGSAVVVVATGAITDGTHTIVIEESDDGAAFAEVADADLIGIEPVIGPGDDNRVYEIGYRGRRRYIRASATVAGATTGGIYGALVVRGRPQVAPV